jgi:hypothetical protein
MYSSVAEPLQTTQSRQQADGTLAQYTVRPPPINLMLGIVTTEVRKHWSHGRYDQTLEIHQPCPRIK